MRFLLTAFEPFDGTGLNASLEGCRAFLQSCAGEFDLAFAVLPVEYGRDTEAVERALREGPFDVLLHTGQARGAEWIRVERLAVNRRFPSNRLKSLLGQQEPIEAGGPPALDVTLPPEAVAAAIREEGLPAAVSTDAGIYLCNHVMYRSLRRAQEHGEETRVGFLHVPCLPEQVAPDQPSMSAPDIARAIRAALVSVRAREATRTAASTRFHPGAGGRAAG